MVLCNLGQASDFGIPNYNPAKPLLSQEMERITGFHTNRAGDKVSKRDFILDIERLSKNKVNAGLYSPRNVNGFTKDAKQIRFNFNK